jgi:CRP-like cAMP-binding protein/rhodanese-related sulfurtransferase
MTAAKKIVDDKLLKTLVPFGELKDEQFAKLSGQYKVETFKAGQTLFKQGERDARTFFLLAGQVNLRYGDGSVKSISADTPQAQYALVPVRPRQATATAKTPITVLSLDANLFDDILSWGNENGFHVSELDTHEDENDWMTCFLQSKVFLRLPAQNIQALMMRLEEVKVKAGQVVIRQGDDDGYYYIIKSGRCRVSRKHSPKDKELELAMLAVGEGFGEEAIITHNRRGASVTMLEDGCLMRLSRNDFNRLLVEPLITIVNYNEVAKDPRSVFLDVRNYEDYARNGITGSKNITITELRLKIDQLDTSKQYVVCSNTGSRAAAAAFLLCQQGIDAVVLRYGLENLPADIKRGNGAIEDIDKIPVVDNVVKLNKETPLEKLPELPATSKEPPRPVTTDEAMKDPRVKALFSQAQRRLQEENDRAKQAYSARKQAQVEVNRLKNEADQARRQLEDAKRQAEKAAKDSAMAARLEAKREAARLRELELGAKQAELEEAMRQAEEQAQRTNDANTALQQAEQEIDNLKKEMQSAVERAQEEAHKSAEAIRQFLEQEAKRQKEESDRITEKEAQRARQAEEAHLKAQQEIERLKADAEATRERLRQQAKLEADRARQQAEQARKEAEREIERLRKETELARQQAEEQALKKQADALAAKQAESEAAIQKAIEQARQEAQAEIERLRERADKAQDAEEARKWAEQEIARVKEQAEQERLRLEEQAIRIAEEARAEAVEEAYKITAAKESEIEAVAKQAADQAKRALEAEEAKYRAEQEIERLKQETELARQQMQHQLSSEIERSEIEHEVAKARALELANKQAEIEDVTKKAEQEASRAMLAEAERKKTEDEINQLKQEMEALRRQQELFAKQQSSGSLSAADKEMARNSEKALADKQEEIAQISLKAAEQIAKANAADEARKQAEVEIHRLRSEVEAATLQAQAQLQADAERAAAEQKAMRERSAELERMQAMIAEAESRAQQEAARAQQAEEVRRQSEEQLARLKAAEEANIRAQEEIQRLKAEAGMAYYQAQEQAKLTAEQIRQKAELDIQKARAEEAARKKAELEHAARLTQQEADRAEQAEQARKLAEAEIKKLKAEAKLQHIKAEKAIRETIKSAREQESKKVQQRATDKARKSVKSEPRKPNVIANKPKSRANSNQQEATRDDDPLGILDLAQPKNPAQENYDFSKETASQGGGGFISDQIMWETALGMREDKVVEQVLEPKSPKQAPITAPARQTGTPQFGNAQPAYAQAQRDQSVFRSKDVNPYVNTQDVTNIVRKRKRSGGLFKYVVVLFSLCVCAAAAYYFTLSNSQRELQREQIKSFIEKEIPSSKQKNTDSQTSETDPVNGTDTRPSKPAPVVVEKRPLTMEERLELKREKAIQDIIQRKKALERKVDKQPDGALPEISEPAKSQSGASEQSTLPALVEIPSEVSQASSGNVEITVVNPVPDNQSEQSNDSPPEGLQLLPLNDVQGPENESVQNTQADSVVQVNEAISVVVTDPISGEEQ